MRENLTYNTDKEKIYISEYGRTIQKMIEECSNISNKEERQKMAENIVYLMTKGNPKQLEIAEYLEKLWTHLMIMSDYKLDVNVPCHINLKEDIEVPNRLNYPEKQKDDYKHYGINIKKMIEIISEMNESDEKESAKKNLISNMKKKYNSWNKSNINDDDIMLDVKILSKGKLI